MNYYYGNAQLYLLNLLLRKFIGWYTYYRSLPDEFPRIPGNTNNGVICPREAEMPKEKMERKNEEGKSKNPLTLLLDFMHRSFPSITLRPYT